MRERLRWLIFCRDDRYLFFPAFAVVFTLRYEAALALEADGTERSVAVLAISIVILFMGIASSSVLAAVCILFPSLFVNFSSLALLTLIPAGVLLSLNIVLQSWAAADGRYHQLNIIRLAIAVLVTLLQVFVGLINSNELTLILMHTVGLFLAFCFACWLKPIRLGASSSVISDCVLFLKRRKKFPVYSLPAGLVSAVTAQLPVMIVTTRFGTEIGGILALTMRIVGAPLGILGKSVLDVFKRQAVIEISDAGRCRKVYLQTFKVLVSGSLIFIIGTLLFAELFFAFTFGAEWQDAGLYAIWLLPLFAMRLIASPLSYTIFVVEKQHLDLFFQFSLLSVTFATLVLHSNLNNTILLYSIICSLLYSVYLYLSFKLS